jgi:adenylate cyclase
LVEFASAVDATECAIKIQRVLARRNEEVPEGHRIELRIGINLGDIIVDGDDIYGDGVNVAARLEALCDTGEVCVSAVVHDQVEGKITATFEDLGEHTVKNIDKPIRVYRVSDQAGASVKATTIEGADVPLPLPDKPSIAVLPFANMSGDPEQEYFSDGIAEDIITALSRIRWFLVIARNSSFSYKGTSPDVREIARELGVRYVLEGSVRKAADRLRITAQLIDAATDHHLWAERYDRDLADIFAVQDEVARHVAEAMAVTLKPGERERLAHEPTQSLEAYTLYMRARGRTWPPSRSNILSARNAYDNVIAVDGSFAGGHAGKSIAYSFAVLFGHSDDRDGDAETAMNLANRAVEIDPKFARSYSALGVAYSGMGRHEEAITASRTAIELQPGDADSHEFHARCLMFSGAGAEACDAIKTALRLDPQYVEGPYLNLLGRASFLVARYNVTINAFERNVARGGPLSPPMSPARAAAACALVGRLDDARRILEHEVLRDYPELTIGRLEEQVHQMRVTIGDELVRLIDGLRKAGLPE